MDICVKPENVKLIKPHFSKIQRKGIIRMAELVRFENQKGAKQNQVLTRCVSNQYIQAHRPANSNAWDTYSKASWADWLSLE